MGRRGQRFMECPMMGGWPRLWSRMLLKRSGTKSWNLRKNRMVITMANIGSLQAVVTSTSTTILGMVAAKKDMLRRRGVITAMVKVGVTTTILGTVVVVVGGKRRKKESTAKVTVRTGVTAGKGEATTILGTVVARKSN